MLVINHSILHSKKLEKKIQFHFRVSLIKQQKLFLIKYEPPSKIFSILYVMKLVLCKKPLYSELNHYSQLEKKSLCSLNCKQVAATLLVKQNLIWKKKKKNTIERPSIVVQSWIFNKYTLPYELNEPAPSKKTNLMINDIVWALT